MATDIAQLSIAIKTGDILRAQKELKKLELQGRNSELATNKLTKSTNLLNASNIALATTLYSVTVSTLRQLVLTC